MEVMGVEVSDKELIELTATPNLDNDRKSIDMEASFMMPPILESDRELQVESF